MLVSIEGIDGSGKTTAWEALRERHGEGVTFTREPTESWYGDAVRRSVGDPDADPLAELFLYTADHAAHLASTVRPALADGRAVVTDRYVDSRYAYQSVTLDGVVADPLAFVMGVHEPWTRPPDRTILLDVDPETAAERSGATDKFEQVAFLRRVADRYDALARRDPERFVRVDATQSPEAVVADVAAAVEDALAGGDGDAGEAETDAPRNADR